MMSLPNTSSILSARRCALACLAMVMSLGQAAASDQWPDCDTSCVVPSYTLASDTVQCLDELAAYDCASLTLVDTCTLEQTLAFHVIGSGADTVTTCNATTAMGIGPDGAIRLLGLSLTGWATSDMFVETGGGLTLTQYANDVAILTGEVANADNADQRFEVFIVYENRVIGADWGGGFKYAMGCEPPTDTWDIYTIKPDQSHLVGRGAYAGSLLQLQHAPSSQFFGFQVGEGANDHNCNYGAGGWFSWSGILCGTEAAGAMGDVIIDLECQSDFDPCTAQSIAYFSAYVPDCGVLQYSIDIVRHDDEGPVIAGIPNDTVVSCFPDPTYTAPEGVTVTDNCPVPGYPTLTYEGIFEVEAAVGYCSTFEERWRAEDECGNVTTAKRLFHQIEEEPPMMVGEEIVIIECDEWPGGFEPPFSALVEAGFIDAVDNCEIDTVLIEYGVMSGGCHYDHIMTYTPVDGCGNVGDSFYQIVVVDDYTLPQWVDVPKDTAISCTASPESITAIATATDNCDPDVNVMVEVNTLDDGDGCDETYIIERVFIAEDCSYNHARDTQLVHVVDTVAPVVSLQLPANVSLEGCFADTDTTTETRGVATWTASDDCGDLTESLSYADGPLNEPCGESRGSASFDRTWTLIVSDCAGNQTVATGVQTITVEDVSAPDLTVEPMVSLDCSDWNDGFDANDAIALGWVTVTDACALEDIGLALLGEFSSECSSALEVEYTALDACGNSTSATQIIQLIDTVAPTFTVLPDNQNLSCDGDPAPYAEGDAQAVDDCGSVSITTHDELVIEDCASSAVWERTITASDVCGNTAVRVQRFFRIDDVNPVISTWPGDTAVACALPAFDPSSIEFDDDCDAVPVLSVLDDTVSYGCPGTFTVERHFTATDCSGNTAEEVQVITVSDTVAPALTISGPHIEISCSEWTCDIGALQALGHVAASDNCGEVDLSVECINFSGGCLDPLGMLTLLYTAEDPCGNITQAEQVLELIDTVAPVGTMECPADVTFELSADCTFDLGAPDADAPWGAASGSATDNCDSNPNWYFAHEDAAPQLACGDAGGMVIERTHHMVSSDQCGNVDTVSCIQLITLLDVTGPALTLNPPLPKNIFGCLADTDTTLAGLGALTATAVDACGGDVAINMAYEDDISLSCNGDDAVTEGSLTLDRTFTVTATDCGGNVTTATHVQTVNFFDIAAPTLALSCPNDTTVEALPDCTADLDVSLMGLPGVLAEDNCDTDVVFSISHSDQEVSGDCVGARTITRTFTVTATDDCGNSASATCQQDIAVVDVTAPSLAIACPADAEVVLDELCSWSGDAGLPVTTVTDGCDSDPLLTLTSVDHDTTWLCAADDALAEGSFAFTRTYTATATDNCGNASTASCSQLITLLDSTAPGIHSLETLPTDTLFIDAQCDVDLAPTASPLAVAEDGCDSEVALMVTHSDDEAVYEALSDGVSLQIDTVLGSAAGATTYRLYAVLNNPTDILSAVVGEGAEATWITSTAPFFQHPFGGTTPSYIDPALVALYPDLAYDSWLTIGIEELFDASAGEAAVQIVESSPWTSKFDEGGSIALNSNFGDGWFSLPTSTNGQPDADGRVLLAQLTTAGQLSGQMYLQILEGGAGGVDNRYTLTFGNACTADDGQQEGSFTFVRTWQSVATDDCGNADTLYTFQNIAVRDTLAPQLTETCGLMNGETVSLDCAGPELFDMDPLPLACTVAAVDNCDTEVGVARFDDIGDDAPTGGVCNICAPSDPAPMDNGLTCDMEEPEAMRLFNLDGVSDASFILDPMETSRFDVQCDSALQVELFLTDGAGGGFHFTAEYGFAGDWDAWSSADNPYHLGSAGSYKKDCESVYEGLPIWLDWNYFVLLDGQLTGTGVYAGSSFDLAHQPSNHFFGFQVGAGANNKNEEYGAGGWFFWDGTLVVDGESQGNLASSGDIFVDLDCCLPWTAEHFYVAADDCANTTPFAYSVTNTGEPASGEAGLTGGSQHTTGAVVIGDAGLSGKQPFRVLGLNPNPTMDLTQLQFEVDIPQRMTIRLHTMTGEHVMNVFDGMAEPGSAYQVEIGVSSLPAGLYQLRLSSTIHSEVRKLLIAD